MTDPTSSGPSAEVRLLADEFLARGDGGELYPYALGVLEVCAHEVVADPTPKSLHRLADVLAGIQLAVDKRRGVRS